MSKLLFILILPIGTFFVGLTLYTNLYFENESLKAQLTDFMPSLPKIDEMKAIYLTVNTAFSSKLGKIIGLVGSSELNSIVIDIKDGEKL